MHVWINIWAACVVAGMIYHVLGSVFCGWLYAGSYRTKLRGLFSLPQEPCHDFLVHGFCCVCSICQEYRELKNQGIDPSIGNCLLLAIHFIGWLRKLSPGTRNYLSMIMSNGLPFDADKLVLVDKALDSRKCFHDWSDLQLPTTCIVDFEGWQANAEKWNREGVVPPIIKPGMAR